MKKTLFILGLVFITSCNDAAKESKNSNTQWEVINTNPNKIEGWLFHRNDSDENGWSIDNGVMTYDASKNTSGWCGILLNELRILKLL